MHPNTRITIFWVIDGKKYEETTTKELFLEHMTQILEETIDKVEKVFYTVNNKTHSVDYYNFGGGYES